LDPSIMEPLGSLSGTLVFFYQLKSKIAGIRFFRLTGGQR